MYVTEVRIENVKGFRDGPLGVRLSLERPEGSPAGWTVLAGRNGSGKTSFLRAIALSIAGPSAARALQESFAGWIRDGASAAHVATRIQYDQRDRFEKTGRLPSQTFWSGLQWERSSSGVEPSLAPHSLNKTMRQTPGRGPWADDPGGWFVAGYGPFRRLTGHASDAQRLMVGPNHVPRLVSLFREDASLLECIQWLKDLYLRRLEEKPGAKELEEGTLRLLDDGMLPDGMKVDRVDSDGLWVRQAGMALPLRDLSDGYRTMVALVLDILRHMHTSYGSLPVKQTPQQTSYIDLPGVVLIDEIDVHLHVSWQQRIGFWLKRRFPRVQFIVASHSPFVCQAADPGGLIRLPAPGERRTAEKVSADLHKRIVRGTADDAALSELFGLESTRSAETTELMQELAELEARITKGTASPSDKRRFRALQIEIPFTPTGSVELALEAIQEAVKIQ